MDPQTYRDLDILSASNDADALFNTFKITRTIGGRERIHEMMLNPLTDLNALRDRTAAIRYFRDQKIELNLGREQLDLVDHYLKHNKLFLKNNPIDALYDYARNKLTPSNDYYIVSIGIASIIKAINKVRLLLKDNLSDDAPEYLKNMAIRITELLEAKPLKTAFSLDADHLKYYHISRLDGIFRGKFRAHIKEIVQLIYELDAFETLAYISNSKGFELPEYLETDTLNVEFKGLFHPSIKNPVSNDVMVNENGNMAFLTGSNMAGKSSLLKAIGISVYLAHLGFPVPCRQMKTTLFNGMITTINLPDNINNGLSHYYSEVKRVKQAASTLLEHEKMFVIFDELFRGTNVKDAYDASLLIISELTAIRNSAFFISTHIVELAEELVKYENITFRYMDTYFENQKPMFTYQLREGISKERLGMYIVQNEGIIEVIRTAAGRYVL